MKKLGDQYTLRGQIPVNIGNTRIQLFDGRFDTGYRIEKLDIVGQLPLNQIEFQMILSTTELDSIDQMNFQDNTQIGWAVWGAPIRQTNSWGEVDPDNLIIEDLFISCRGSEDNSFCNYMITMQKYDIDEWQGALGMVRNRSQT